MASTEASRIVEQIRAAFEGSAWHGSSLMENVSNVASYDASQRPLCYAHSIWEIINHLNAWDRVIPARLNHNVVDLEGENDWPPVHDTSPEAWKRALESIKADNEALRNSILSLDDAQLHVKPQGKEFDIYTMLHGIPQHIAYHSGQIAIVKKGLRY